jgi:hypothetical protein
MTHPRFVALALVCAGLAHPSSGHAEGFDLGVRLNAELGFLAVAAHTIKFSNSGTNIDYVDEGGQDVLFPYTRWSVDLRLARHHHLTLLFQPLEIDAEVRLKRAVSVDELTFPEGTPTRMLYRFPFWRLSYVYDFFAEPETTVAVGGGLQIRDATITFQSLDGELLRSNRGVGPVPVLAFRARTPIGDRFWFAGEIEGFYAPISVLNGSDDEITGAIVDTSVRVGMDLPHGTEAYLNVRYIGGGAVGTDNDHEGPGDGYIKNWLHFITVSLGLSLNLL